MRTICIISFLIIVNLSQAQNNFIKLLNNTYDATMFASQLLDVEDTLYAWGMVDSTFYNGVYMAKMDTIGELISFFDYPDKKLEDKAIIYEEDKDQFVLCGEKLESSNPEYYIMAVDRRGEVIIEENINLSSFSDGYIHLHSITSDEGQYAIAGSYVDYGVEEYGILIWLDEDYEIIEIHRTVEPIIGVGDLTVTEGGTLIGALTQKNEDNGFEVILAEFDAVNFFTDSSFICNERSNSHEGRQILAYNANTSNISLIGKLPEGAEVLTIDTTGSIQWIFDRDMLPYFYSDSKVTSVNHLRNGDIVVGGYAYYLYGNNPFNIPMIYCVTSSGEYKWIRYMLKHIGGEEYSFEVGYVTNIVEKENGDLYVYGGFNSIFMHYYGIHTPFLIKTDSLGCIHDDCGYENFIVGLREITQAEEIEIIPNPASSHIAINQDFENFYILDGNGRQLISGFDYFQRDQINVSKLTTGAYIILGKDTDDRMYIGKFVKM